MDIKQGADYDGNWVLYTYIVPYILPVLKIYIFKELEEYTTLNTFVDRMAQLPSQNISDKTHIGVGNKAGSKCQVNI